uniref:Uncharacterized protein n=1 Tax=Steinernema glaseri TaxID=37863 RepID=A0A1I7Z2Y5_9BILA
MRHRQNETSPKQSAKPDHTDGTWTVCVIAKQTKSSHIEDDVSFVLDCLLYCLLYLYIDRLDPGTAKK